MNCLDCKLCVPAKKRLQIRNGRNYGFIQLYVCKDRRRYISKKFFDILPEKDHCFEPKEQEKSDLM